MFALLIIGVFTIIFGHNLVIQGGITCVCWALAVAVIIAIAKTKNEQELLEFDQQAREILEDIALLGEESEYFPFYNIDIVNNIRFKLLKKHKKQAISLITLCAVLVVMAICCMV